MNPNHEVFSREDYANTPLLAGIESFAESTGRSMEELESMTMGAIVEAAKCHYGDDLPEIWRIWIDWNEDDTIQPMGDL